jgi:glycosyltransferase involved in cell wall biosynthesis
MASRAPLLSAAMIVRDEEANLGPCLDSLNGIVDEVVVVDTGSSDDSVAVARSHGARVFQDAWADDFSRARNAALDRVRGRWVLYIDADERLRPISRESVVDLLEPAEEVAFRVLLRPFVGATASREFRLWRNDARIRFDGIIHEKVVPAIQAVARAEGRSIGTCDLVLDHLGYEHDQTRKHLRNLPLLRRQLAVEPGNVFNLRHLAAVLAALGDDEEAEQALERAVDLVRADDAPPGGSLAYADLVRLRHPGVGSDRLIDEAIGSYPNDPLLIWVKAVMELEAGHAHSALTWLDRLASIDPKSLDDTISYDERLFGVFMYQARGLALFRLGRYRDAADAYGDAESCEPDHPEHRVKRLMADHLAALPGGAPPELSTRVVEIAGVATRFQASDVERLRAVDSVIAGLPVHRGDHVLEVTFGTDATPTPEGRHDYADGAVRAWWRGDDLFLTHGRFAAHVGGTRAQLSGDGEPGRAFRQLFPYVVTHLLASRDLYVLHAGAVQRGHHAVLVLGGTGSGKSTVVVGALRSGWTALADDLVVVRLGQEGPEVLGIAKPLAVPADIVEAVPVPVHPIVGDVRGRWQVPADASSPAWFPVASTIVSAHGAASEGGFSALTSKELFEWLLYSFLARHERGRLRCYLRVAAALTCLESWQLYHGRDASTRVRQVEDLLQRIESKYDPARRGQGNR